MVEGTLQLTDIPDLSTFEGDRTTSEPFLDGWYGGTILEKRAFTDSNGNDRVFESSDTPSQNGASRNIKLQIELKRQSDGRALNISALTNYQPEDLTQAVVQAVNADTARAKEGEKRTMFREFMVLDRLSKLQRIAGVRQLQRNGNGGLELTPLFGKKAFFRIGPDKRSDGKYKAIIEYSEKGPKQANKVL